jgi:peroxiredoxin
MIPRRILAAAAAASLFATGAFAQHQGHGHEGTPPPAPVAGEVVAAFTASALDGSARNVAFSGKNPTVLLFFLSSCPTCHRMIPDWNRAFQRKAAGLQVVGVLMDQEPPGFFTTTPVAFPVVRSPGREFLQKMKVYRAPMMLRVAPGGKVQDVVVGYADPIKVGEIFRP